MNIYDESVQFARPGELATQRGKPQIDQAVRAPAAQARGKEKTWAGLESYLLRPWNTWTYLFCILMAAASVAVLCMFYGGFAWISLLIHEAGHYVAGKLTGWHIIEVRLGGGRVVKVSRRKGTAWYWYWNPHLGGWVHGVPRNGVPSRFRQICFAAGGPIATAFFLGALVWAWMATSAFRAPLAFQSIVLTSILKFTIFYEAIYLFTALYPSRYTNYGQDVESDGMILQKLIFQWESLPAPTEAQRLIQNALELQQRGQMKESVELAQQAVQACPLEEQDLYRLCVAELLMKSDRFEEGRAVYREQLDRIGVTDPQYAVVLDQFVTYVLFGNASSFYAECESELRKALAATPDAVHLKDTLAGLLAECGRDDEAAPLLRETYRRADHEVAIGISAAYLSVLEEKRGRAKESAKFRGRAIEFLSNEHPLLKRLFQLEGASAA